MAKSLEEKRREREAAKLAATGAKPPAPRAAPLAEPPAPAEVAVAPETKRALRATQAKVEAPAPGSDAQASMPLAAAHVAVSPPRIASPKHLIRAPPTDPKVAPVAAAPPAPVRKAPPPMPAAEVPVPESLAGADLSILDEAPTPAPAELPEPVAEPAKEPEPPKAAPAPAPAEKPAATKTKKVAFKEEGEGRRIGAFRIEYDGTAGPDAVKARVIAHGKEHEVVLPKGDSQKVSFQTAEGSEVSVALMFSGVNGESDKEILVDVPEAETNAVKAKQAAAKAVSKTGSALASVKKHALEIVLGAYGAALATTVFAVADLRVWMEQHMGAWRWPAAIGIPLVMVGLAVWSAIEHSRKPEQKTDDKKEA